MKSALYRLGYSIKRLRPPALSCESEGTPVPPKCELRAICCMPIDPYAGFDYDRPEIGFQRMGQ